MRDRVAAQIGIDPTTETPAQLPKIEELPRRCTWSLVQLPAFGPVAG
ncbi:hypothetical protein P3H15_43035 [Rhodococcus sp. T2V]|nr:hypothetical protein [Rhodococcus sp. T2V]MDF3311760.1 hypothetical protein [Rhodococcus sp. T2V]